MHDLLPAEFSDDPGNAALLLGAEADRILAEIGLPHGAHTAVSRIPGEVATEWLARSGKRGRWNGYTVEWLGLEVPVPLQEAPPWPSAVMATMNWRVFRYFQLWLRRVRLKDTPLYLEARWHPERGERLTLCGLAYFQRLPNKLTIERGIQLLDLTKTMDLRGRPTGTGTFESPKHFLATVRPAVQELRRRGKNPTTGEVLKQLATRLGRVDKGQFTHWYQSLGWRRWADVLKELN